LISGAGGVAGEGFLFVSTAAGAAAFGGFGIDRVVVMSGSLRKDE
jgi:hypothetical protein